MAAALETDAAFQKKIFGSRTTTLIFSNKDLNDVMKKVKYLESTSLLIEGVRETFENKVKEQKRRFLGMLTVILTARCYFIRKYVNIQRSNNSRGGKK